MRSSIKIRVFKCFAAAMESFCVQKVLGQVDKVKISEVVFGPRANVKFVQNSTLHCMIHMHPSQCEYQNFIINLSIRSKMFTLIHSP